MRAATERPARVARPPARGRSTRDRRAGDRSAGTGLPPGLGRALLGAALLGSLGACASAPPEALRAPPSSPPFLRPPAERGLRAGFGRADLTPPPGVPLSGHGFDGRQSVGYRHRLYARALVLEDARGERLAIVVADLGHPSLIVHRLAAERTAEAAGIGADRLFLAVTHTHSGPGNVYDARHYNLHATPVGGYDPALARFLAKRIARAVVEAERDLAPAVAGWAVGRVEGVSRNRSLDAYLRNPVGRRLAWAAALGRRTRDLASAAVDDTLLVLRVDRCGPGWADCRPKGALSVFAVHSTALPAANPLVDGDLHAVVEREVEARIEGANPELRRGFRSGAFHLFANGAEGDVSPAWDPETRCEGDRTVRFARRPGGPRSPRTLERWTIPPKALERCLALAREGAVAIGRRIAHAVAEAYDRARRTGLSRDVRVGRAVRTLDLPGGGWPFPLCAEPRAGTASVGGAEDGRTRLHRWRTLGLIPTGFEEGGAAIRRPAGGCHGAKAVAGGGLQRIAVARGGLPRRTDLAVLRAGRVALAAVPGEWTTEAGRRAKRAILQARIAGVERAGMLGLVNGYLQYVATAEEYEVQSYEGGSTLYGPDSERGLRVELARLARSLAAGQPIVEAGEIVAHPGPRRRLLPPRDRGPDPATIERRASARCRTRVTAENSLREGVAAVGAEGSRVLAIRWLDAYPGALVPADGPFLEIRALPGDSVVAWDDRHDLDVRAVGPRDGAYEWEARWLGPEPGGEYEVRLLARDGGPPELATAARCP